MNNRKVRHCFQHSKSSNVLKDVRSAIFISGTYQPRRHYSTRSVITNNQSLITDNTMLFGKAYRPLPKSIVCTVLRMIIASSFNE